MVRLSQLRASRIGATDVTTGVAGVISTTVAAFVATSSVSLNRWPPPAKSSLPGAYETEEPDTPIGFGMVPSERIEPVPVGSSFHIWLYETPKTCPSGAIEARGYHHRLSSAPNATVLAAPVSRVHAPVPVPISGVTPTLVLSVGVR
jgi:hypothetical protein